METHSLPDVTSLVPGECLHIRVTPDTGIEICRGFLNSIFTFTASEKVWRNNALKFIIVNKVRKLNKRLKIAQLHF